MAERFVHAEQRSIQAAADKRNVKELKHTLQAAVFTVAAMQYREKDIDVNRLVRCCF